MGNTSELKRLRNVVNWMIYQEVAQNERELAEELGYTKSSFSQIMNGKVPLSERFVRKLCSLDGNINLVWIKTGEGSMFKTEPPTTATPTADTAGNNTHVRTLPLVPFEALAGAPTEDTAGVRLEECERYRVPEFIDGGAQYLVRVSGDSMTPRYNNGDIVAVRRVEDVQFFQWGKIYVLDTNQGALIKRVYRDREDDSNIICHSENEEVYQDFCMPKAAVRGLFVIVGVIHTE